MNNDATIFIPTYNRPDLLARTLRFLQHDSLRLPIIVGDGSEPGAAVQNEEACKQSGANIEYFHVPSPSEYGANTRSYLRRFKLALERVKTPFVACCADDDILLPETVVKAAAFLAKNHDYVACEGIYLTFQYDGDRLRIDGKCYDSPSVDGGEIGSRLMQFYSRYEAPYYAVTRTSVQRAIFDRAQDINTAMLVETFQSAALVTAGKLKRLDNIYNLRNLGVAPHARPVEGWNQWMARDFDDFFENYRAHRAKVIEFVSSLGGPQIDLPTLRRALDMSFVVYLGREFHTEYWIDKYVMTVIADRDERNKLRQLLDARLMARTSPQASLGNALKALVKSVINKGLGKKGMRFATQVVHPAVKNLTDIVPLAQDPSIRISRGLVSMFSDADWAFVSQRMRAD
jgi:glycosyltransferase domain-containing protein